MRLCAVARDGAAGSRGRSQRAGQLGTSCPCNHPAACLNLQCRSALRLKEAAWRANLSVARCDLIFPGCLVGGNWEGWRGLIEVPERSLESRTTEADGSKTSV